jgi:hypothetical protein
MPSTGAAPAIGCQSANGSAYVAEVFCYLRKAGVANHAIDIECGPLLAHDLHDSRHACLSEIERYQALLTTAQSVLRLQNIASVPVKVRTPATWLSRAVTDDLAAARRAAGAVRSHDYLCFLDAWGVHAKAGRDLQAAAATFAAQ